MNNALLATGRYLAFYPGSVLRFSHDRLALRVLKLDLPIPSTPLGIITLKDRTLAPVAKLFIDCARRLTSPDPVDK
jgi:DNA-binding transcriptional LysR family regulator